MKIKDKKLFELLREYFAVYLPLQRSVSPYTVKSYRETLNMYLGFLCTYKRAVPLKDLSFSDITEESLNAFLSWLSECRNCGLSTQNHRLSVIRAFLKYAGMKEPSYNDCYLSSGQVARRKTIKKMTVNHFDEETLNAILSQPNPKERNGHRDLFFMILLYDTGARNGEILNLMPRDIVADAKAPYVIIHGKGKKVRMVPLLKETVQHHESYMNRFHRKPEADTPLFYTVIHSTKRHMSDDNVGRFISKYADMARAGCPSVPEKVTPHMFRHSRALSLYRKGVPLPLISEWLGHANLETTLIYSYADTEMKRAAIEKATTDNHPIREMKAFDGKVLDDELLKRLYGLA
jgi:site-specific recombinase XerD